MRGWLIGVGHQTNIEWTDSTWNPWIGCTKVSPGCDHCYADDMNDRFRWTEWGPKGLRKTTSDANWRKLAVWNRTAKQDGTIRFVFVASLADVFDNQAPLGARERMFDIIRECDRLVFQMLTKRPQNIERYLPSDWGEGWPNVWIGISAENQLEYDRRWPILARTQAALRFVSYEPALGPLQFDDGIDPDWLICGGESGRRARPMKPQWARDMRDQCAGRLPFFFKQWGSWESNPLVKEDSLDREKAKTLDPHGKGGSMIDGRRHLGMPKVDAAIKTGRETGSRSSSNTLLCVDAVSATPMSL